MQITTVEPANISDKCDCCGRTERKLKRVDGFWLGSRCLIDYRAYKLHTRITDYVWVGDEKIYNKVDAMVKAKQSK